MIQYAVTSPNLPAARYVQTGLVEAEQLAAAIPQGRVQCRTERPHTGPTGIRCVWSRWTDLTKTEPGW